jgi:hypothetical protein
MQPELLSREDVLGRISEAFTKRDGDYRDKRKARNVQLSDLEDEIARREKPKHLLVCSRQKLTIASWLAHYTDDWTSVDDAITETRASLVFGPDEQARAAEQDPTDGSWGSCYNARYDGGYHRLEPTVDALQLAGRDPKTIKPLKVFSRFSSTPMAIGNLWQMQIADIYNTGVNTRDELSATQTALAQLLFKDQLHDLLLNNDLGFRFSGDLEEAFRDYLAQSQHPRNGYWGTWYRFDGELVMTHDLSFTFHVIHYLRGDIGNWRTVVDTTMAIKAETYPFGWLSDDGKYNLHNCYDVVQIFAYGWPHMDWDQKVRVRGAILAMLSWCLTDTITPDGVFDPGHADAVEYYYFGVRFLDVIGFWRDDKRFWYVGAIPQPLGTKTPYALCRSMVKRFRALDDGTEPASEVLRILQSAVAETAPPEELRAS